MFHENRPHRVAVVRNSVSKESCDIVIYQEVPIRKEGFVERAVRTLSFFRHDDQVLKLGLRGKLPLPIYQQCHSLAVWAMRPDGPLIDELNRRKSGEITDELVSELSLTLMSHYRVVGEALTDDSLRGQVSRYMRQYPHKGGLTVTSGLINAVHDYVSLTLDGDSVREQMRKEKAPSLAA